MTDSSELQVIYRELRRVGSHPPPPSCGTTDTSAHNAGARSLPETPRFFVETAVVLGVLILTHAERPTCGARTSLRCIRSRWWLKRLRELGFSSPCPG